MSHSKTPRGKSTKLILGIQFYDYLLQKIFENLHVFFSLVPLRQCEVVQLCVMVPLDGFWLIAVLWSGNTIRVNQVSSFCLSLTSFLFLFCSLHRSVTTNPSPLPFVSHLFHLNPSLYVFLAQSHVQSRTWDLVSNEISNLCNLILFI